MTSESNMGGGYFVNLRNMLFLTINCCSNKSGSDKRVAASMSINVGQLGARPAVKEKRIKYW